MFEELWPEGHGKAPIIVWIESQGSGHEGDFFGFLREKKEDMFP